MPAYAAVLLITIVGGVWVCGRAAKTLGVHDHGGIVLDEIAGVWLAMWTFPATWPWLMAGFVVFRVFDIFKPWPINVLDRKVSGGLGIMLDDLVAGAMTWVVLFGLHKLL
jgi:phosphatidylglycerophosphatase A